MYGAGTTLRFPRFISFREDKSWKDIMTWTGKLHIIKGSISKGKSWINWVYYHYIIHCAVLEMNEAKREGTLGGKKRGLTHKDFT